MNYDVQFIIIIMIIIKHKLYIVWLCNTVYKFWA